MSLKNQIAVITGAGRGIGRAIAIKLAKEGAVVVVNSLTSGSAEKTASDINEMGLTAMPYPADVTQRENVLPMIDAVMKRYGAIHILVSNVGFASHLLVEDMPLETWDRMMEVNLTTPFILAKAVLPHMIKEKFGKIVFVGSVAARRISGLGSADYTTAKYGTRGFSKHLAFEVARHGINVNMVNPGITLTDMTLATTTEEERAELGKEFPLGRLSAPEDIAEAVCFLVSESSRQITGSSIDVEGGALIMHGTGYKKNLDRRVAISKERLRGG
ncbi:MAG: SDR family oxidoreductase [Pseudomonadota bacterium]